MASCAVYIQLFTGWLLLNIATFSMATVPYSTHFLGIAPYMDDAEKFVVFGLWVLVEIALFFILLVAATIILCTCKNAPPGAGFIHLMVDPAFVTMGCIPFLLIRGLPRASAIHSCIMRLSHEISTNMSWSSPLQGHAALCVDFGLAPYGTGNNLSATEARSHWTRVRDTENLHLNGWVCMLQVAVLVPVTIRLIHYRWKMSWQPFLHSNAYFFIQSLDIATMMASCVLLSGQRWALLLQCLVYLTCLALCGGCLTIAIPPIYIGNQITNKYIKVSSYIGTAVVDIPFMGLRVYMASYHEWYPELMLDGLFYIMLVKELACVFSVVCIICKKVSLCVGSTYLSLNAHDSDFEDYDAHEMEAYV